MDASCTPAYRHLYALRRSWIVVALIVSGLAFFTGRRFHEAASATTSLATPSESVREPPIDPLLQESFAVAPWECTSCDDSLATIVNLTKSVLCQHPLVLLDVALLVILNIPTTGKFLTHVLPRVVFSPSALSWWWTRYLTRFPWSKNLISLSRHGRRTIRSLVKTMRRLYKNRSKVATLTDYTWYVGTSSESTSITKDEI